MELRQVEPVVALEVLEYGNDHIVHCTMYFTKKGMAFSHKQKSLCWLRVGAVFNTEILSTPFTLQSRQHGVYPGKSQPWSRPGLRGSTRVENRKSRPTRVGIA